MVDNKKVRDFITKMKAADLRKLVASYNRSARLRITRKRKADIINEIMNQKEHEVFRKAIHRKLSGTSIKKASPKKASPKKASPKKASPKKASPKKASPKKTETKKTETKKMDEPSKIKPKGNRSNMYNFLAKNLIDSAKKIDSKMSKTDAKRIILESRRKLLKELKKIEVPQEFKKKKSQLLMWYRKFNLSFIKDLTSGEKTVKEMKALLKKNDEILFRTLVSSITPN